MKLLEYSSKEVLKRFGLPIQAGEVAKTVEEVEKIVEKLKFPVVIKAQVPVGGRGKAGGVKLAHNKEEAIEKAKAILGMQIKGITVKKVLVTEAVDIDKEIYAGVVVDRRSKRPVVMVSSEGGVDIEEVARTKPEAIHKYAVDPILGFPQYKARELAFKVVDDPKLAVKFSSNLVKLYNAFVGLDAQLAEINPFVIDKNGELWAVDAKVIVDDNALFRHPDIEQMRDLDYENLEELEAKKYGLSFVKLDGYVGCMVNGAGLAMATMDIIKKYGGDPANFLDVGGSSNPEKVIKAMQIILEDPNVKSIYVNIFGGITRCDDIAKGLIEAFSSMDVKVPVVIRLTGTNEELGKKMLEESGLPLVTASTMAEGAQKAIELAKQG